VGVVPASAPTVPDDPAPAWQRFERALRGVAVVVVAGIVAAALLGWFGLRLGTATAGDGNLEVAVRYAEISRPGLATPFTVKITTRDGTALPDEVEVAIPTDYLAMFDENGLDPEPTTSDADADTTFMTFEPTRGQSVLAIDFDARLEPDVHRGKSASVTVRAGGDRTTVDFRTRVAP
jgi:hypothetical protein